MSVHILEHSTERGCEDMWLAVWKSVPSAAGPVTRRWRRTAIRTRSDPVVGPGWLKHRFEERRATEAAARGFCLWRAQIRVGVRDNRGRCSHSSDNMSSWVQCLSWLVRLAPSNPRADLAHAPIVRLDTEVGVRRRSASGRAGSGTMRWWDRAANGVEVVQDRIRDIIRSKRRVRLRQT